MSGVAYLNGRFVPAEEAVVPVSDAGFVLGTTVTEQLRTFGGKLFRLDEHLERLASSLEIVGVQPPESMSQIRDAAEEVIAKNYPLAPSGGDLGLCIFVTPGPYGTLAESAPDRPTVCVHSYRLPFERWAAAYDTGLELATTRIQQVSPESWPPELKCRSRMHYYLADREAARIRPGAKALLLDGQGRVCETATANIVAYDGQTLATPPPQRALAGLTLHAVAELAARQGIAWQATDLTVETLRQSAEVVLTSTPWCLLPVVRIDGNEIGDGRPGSLFHQLLTAFGETVGLDIAAQARQFRGE